MDQVIEALVTRGKKKINQDEQKRKKEESARIETLKNTWREIEDQWRGALPEEVRSYIEAVSENEISQSDPMTLRRRDLYITVPGFAPIKTSVEKDTNGVWIQIRNSEHGRLSNYIVPGSIDKDDEDEPFWNWRVGNRTTDELDVALAWAKEEYKRFVAMRSNHETKLKKTELSYENLEDAEMMCEFSEESLRDIVRIIADEMRTV